MESFLRLDIPESHLRKCECAVEGLQHTLSPKSVAHGSKYGNRRCNAGTLSFNQIYLIEQCERAGFRLTVEATMLQSSRPHPRRLEMLPDSRVTSTVMLQLTPTAAKMTMSPERSLGVFSKYDVPILGVWTKR